MIVWVIICVVIAAAIVGVSFAIREPLALCALIIPAFILTVTAITYNTLKTVTFTVSDKAVAATSDGKGGTDHEYQIFTTTGDVYSDNDSFTFWKFDSSNVYAKLLVGHTYTCRVTGFRIPILSMKNNILDCTEVN